MRTRTKFVKKTMIFLAAAVCALALVFSGCSSRDGVDGKNGRDFDIYQIYEAYVSETEAMGDTPLTFLEFINSYLDVEYTASELDEVLSVQAAINRSLLSCVSVTAAFSGISATNATRTITSASAGSGVIVDIDRDAGDAYVVTNCHVVYNEDLAGKYATCVHVALYGQEDYMYAERTTNRTADETTIDIEGGIEAKIVAAAPSYDLALLKVTGSEDIKNSNATAAKFVDDDVTDMGQRVYAIGNPGGYGMSVTEGIVSKDSEYIGINFDSNENLVLYYRVLRTDTALNSGNSGGGLFNSEGKLVGIVNSKSSDDYEGVSYAIPAGTARRVVESMMDSEGSSMQVGISKPVYGVELDADPLPSYVDENGNTQKREAVYVVNYDRNGLGKDFETNDVIKHITITSSDGVVKEDLDIERLYMVSDALISVRVGDEVTFTVSRDNEEVPISHTMTDSEIYSGSRWEEYAKKMEYDLLFCF